MSERERWIVYPLIFFALGGALRDKFFQQVTTKDVHCERLFTDGIVCNGGIVCEEVAVLNPDKSRQVLVQLGIGEQTTPENPQASQRVGVLILRDSKGRELCGVSNNELFVRQINCEGVRVIDPDDPRRILAGLGSLAIPSKEANAKPERFGVLALNNQKFGRLVGNPPTAPPPPAGAPAQAPPPATPNDASPPLTGASASPASE